MGSRDDKRPRVVLHPRNAPGLDAELGTVGGIDLITPDDDDGVIAALEDEGQVVLVTMSWNEAFATPGLRWIQSTTAGVEQFPIDALGSRDVVLTSARGVHAPAVGLHAFALLLALVRRIGESMRDAPQRGWQARPAFELAGRTMGVLGLGTIGEEVARLASAHGMHVIGTKRDPSAYTGVADVLPADATKQVCSEADVVVVTLPASPESDGLVGAAELEALGSGWIVNVGRGTVIDEDALIDALRNGSLIGAGLDVFADEPLPANSEFWELDNVVITPHMAWSSEHLPRRLASLFEENLAAFRGRSEWVNRIT
jgi:D-2-hydroxyacid dehydrogenase (NADP+)